MNEFLGCSCCPADGAEPGIADENWTTYCTDSYSAVEEEDKGENVLPTFKGFKSQEELDKEYEEKMRLERERLAALDRLKKENDAKLKK